MNYFGSVLGWIPVEQAHCLKRDGDYLNIFGSGGCCWQSRLAVPASVKERPRCSKLAAVIRLYVFIQRAHSRLKCDPATISVTLQPPSDRCWALNYDVHFCIACLVENALHLAERCEKGFFFFLCIKMAQPHEIKIQVCTSATKTGPNKQTKTQISRKSQLKSCFWEFCLYMWKTIHNLRWVIPCSKTVAHEVNGKQHWRERSKY